MKNTWKILIGLVLVAAGAFFILSSVGVIPADYRSLVTDYWPALIILLSLALLIDGATKKGTPIKRFDRIYFAAAVAVTGGVLLNNRIHFLGSQSVGIWGVLLSLLLIFIGIRLIFFKRGSIVVTIGDHDGHSRHGRRKTIIIDGKDVTVNVDRSGSGKGRTESAGEGAGDGAGEGAGEGAGDDAADVDEDADEDEDGDETVHVHVHADGASERVNGKAGTAGTGSRKGVYTKTTSGGTSQERFIGELRLGDKPWAPENAEYTVNVGDMSVDLTTAILEDGETVLKLSGWVGNIDIILPEDLAVDIAATVNIGSVEFFGKEEHSGISRTEVRYKSEKYDEAVKRVKISASLNIGDIEVKTV